ncbi:hypothetical protein MTO96_007253 [Rhipicephalus appendiculatus]
MVGTTDSSSVLSTGEWEVFKGYLICTDMSLGIKMQEAIELTEQKLGDAFDHETVTHWRLGFCFGRTGAMLADFVIDPTGLLVPSARWTAQKRLKEIRIASPWSKPFTTVKIGNRLGDLHDLGKYRLLQRNCQEAIKRLLKLLKIKMPDGLLSLKDALNAAGDELFQGGKD